jgi:hypothetical protein
VSLFCGFGRSFSAFVANPKVRTLHHEHLVAVRVLDIEPLQRLKKSGASLSGRKHHAGFLDPAPMCLRLFV